MFRLQHEKLFFHCLTTSNNVFHKMRNSYMLCHHGLISNGGSQGIIAYGLNLKLYPTWHYFVCILTLKTSKIVILGVCVISAKTIQISNFFSFVEKYHKYWKRKLILHHGSKRTFWWPQVISNQPEWFVHCLHH